MASSEPKSIHTWFETDHNDIIGYSVDVCIAEFSANIPITWLYYPALQLYFTDHDEWAHGGLQWAGVVEFKESSNKGINWGGGSSWAGYGGNGRTNCPFVWQVGQTYGYQARRGNIDQNGLTHWLFKVVDYAAGAEFMCGAVKTKSSFIKQGMVFTETGYGVQCDSPPVRIEWSNPCFETPSGRGIPHRLVANYNGTCPDEMSTNQDLVSATPLHLFHETSCRRTIPPNRVLWPKT